ncbi:LacI family DNA-binding transcriptional regulator [Cerasicoccus frondis]|uniref:LacI family DNA-binding transcriptional regulator n=1 Tax=Cerasicoccus frondis TaxID=490090 RepID=UPI0028527B08|nr:LacI family DNA-binding transcriptional regulator [Cerasicoccus frondis]
MPLDIVEFSKQIGVSTATVSRAFSGRGRISEKTRERVLEEARARGFSPNVHASRLNSKRTNQIGLYYSFSEDPIFDYYNMELAQEIAKAAEKRGQAVHLELSRTGKGENHRLRQLTGGGGLDGIILVVDGRTSGARLLESVQGCPVVVVTNRAWAPIQKEIVVELDIFSGMVDAVRDLASLGHKRIGFIGGTGITAKVNGFRRILEDCKLTVDPKLIAEGSVSFSDGQKAFHQVASQRPSAVFCATDVLAMGALNEANAMGLNVPGDISIVGMDDLAFTAYTTPSLSTVGIPRSQIAKTAVDSIISQLDDEESESPRALAKHVIGSYYVPRASVGAFTGA